MATTWIPVSEGLPQEGVEVVTLYQDGPETSVYSAYPPSNARPMDSACAIARIILNTADRAAGS